MRDKVKRRLPIVHELLGRLYSEAEWEALCNRCGACCYESRWTDVGWQDTGVPCSFLDEAGLRFEAYGRRFEVEDDCIRVDPAVVLQGIMPLECSYLDELSRIIEEDHGGQDPRVGGRGRRSRQQRRERDPDAEPPRHKGKRGRRRRWGAELG